MVHFDFRLVLKDTLTVLRANPAFFAIVASFLVGIDGLTVFLAGSGEDIDIGVYIGCQVVVNIVSALTLSLMTVAATYATYRHYRGEKPRIGEYIGFTVPALPVVFGAMIAYYVLVVVAALFLFIPGIYVFIVYWVVIPVVLMERTGFTASFKRSGFLTLNCRWHIFIVTIIINLPFVVIGLAVIFLTDGGAIMKILDWLFLAVSSAVNAAANAVGYFHLRSDKSRKSIRDIVTAGS